MELTCAIIVITVGLGAASPYGYGTKGGALAKGESSAVAGGLPITAPSGSGYSGSYAKSSSSSFASSSASSSASSFSFSGSGAYPGVVPGATGCGTVACPSKAGYSPTSYGSQSFGNNNAGSTGTDSTGSGNNYNSDNANHGQRGDINESQKATDCSSGSCQKPAKPAGYSNGLANSFSLATSVASAGAVYGSPSKGPAIPDSGCAGGDCGNQPGSDDGNCISGQCGGNANSNLKVNEKCTSGNCKVPPTGYVTPLRVNENNCASGNCGSTRNDNDIEVPKPNYQGTIHFSDKDKGINYGSSCAYGSCEPNNAKPTHSQDSAPVLETAKCNTPGCKNYGLSATAISNAAATAYNKPSTQLVAPKEDTICTTPNCQSGPSNTKPNGYSPNYNAPTPIYTPDQNPSQCAGSTCHSQTKSPYSTNYVNPTLASIGNGCTSPNCGNNRPIKSQSNCADGSCDYNPSSENNKQFDRQPGYNTNYEQSGTTYSTPVPSGSGCSLGSLNCSPGPILSGQYNPVVTPSPYYTPPVLGSPTGSSTYNKPPSFKPATVAPSGYSGSLNYPYSQPNNAAASAAQQSNGYNKPGTSGYGSYPSGPAFISQGTSPSSYSLPGTYPAPGLNSPTQNCNTPKCLSSGISSLVPSSAISGNIPTPIGGEKDKHPVYQGGFGGPNGILNPNDFHFSPPPSIKPALPVLPLADTASIKPDCVSGNCGQPFPGGFGSTTGILKPNKHNISPPTGFKPDSSPVRPVSKPDCVSGNCEQPFNGGFGGPTGILKPNEYNISPPTGFKPDSSPVRPVSKPDCVSGNCEQPIHGGFGGPTGILKPNEHDISPPTSYKPGSSPVGSVSKPDCVSGNCGQPIVGSFSPSYAQSGTISGAQASASAKAVAYTGGFGGPPGILTPYDDGKIDLPIGGKQFSQNALNQDSGNHASNSNANENGSHGHSGAQAQSIAQANAVAGEMNPQSSGYKPGECDGGCSGSSGGTNHGSNGGYGLSKSGTSDGIHGGLSIASASAKSIAGADPNVRGGYASSSASAQASSGIKSSYGKR